ncbi:hypothetical protein [uncultured Thalassospira sp.]|uniref:hypothetical protein n=1 Tax=uncultured Thalassospira sp. TaxID=404382 RepID=UPI0030DA0C61|tara:strand:- start:43877 stop:44239 length:363 start_codon:yes stop_codon:yes gene_type:complete
MADNLNYKWDDITDLHGFAMNDDHCNISCIHCGYSAKLYFGPLLIKHGPTFKMGPYLKNLRCSQCNDRGATPRTSSHYYNREKAPFFCPISHKSIYDCLKGACKKGCTRPALPEMGEFQK